MKNDVAQYLEKANEGLLIFRCEASLLVGLSVRVVVTVVNLNFLISFNHRER